MYRFLPDLADVARSTGLKVVELPGWAKRGRPAYTGNFDPRGVLCHHTGAKSNGRLYATWMTLTGRSDLPAPLVQLSIDRQGTVYVCAGGRANHAGKARASGPMPSGDGNALYVGIEAQNTGTEGWTRVQYDAYVRMCAALCKHYGWAASHVRAHKETSTTGKWDPGALNMDKFRADVAAAIGSTPTPVDPGKPQPTDKVYLPNMVKAAKGKDPKEARWGISRVQEALNARYQAGLGTAGNWGPKTTEAYKHHQAAIGSPARYCDGIPGPTDLADLGKGRFTVTGV